MLRMLVPVVMVGLFGCDGRRSLGDAGSVDVDSSMPPAPPGEVRLTVQGSSWDDRGLLYIGVAVSNGSGGEPARLAWDAFTLETSVGAILDAHPRSSEVCPMGVSVAPGASLSCAVMFDVATGAGDPTVLHYRTDTRRASATIDACGPSSPGGLCSPGMVCGGGRCGAPCSLDNPEGLCAGTSGVCRDGSCPCSSTVTNGYCDVGACFDGNCDATCAFLDGRTRDCGAECLASLSASGTCEIGVEGRIGACFGCAAFGDPRTTCDCAASPECDGHEDPRAMFDCVVAACPACVVGS